MGLIYIYFCLSITNSRWETEGNVKSVATAPTLPYCPKVPSSWGKLLRCKQCLTHPFQLIKVFRITRNFQVCVIWCWLELNSAELWPWMNNKMVLMGSVARGGVGRRNALMGERVLRRAVKRRASEWWLTPVSNSSDWRRDKRKGPRSPGESIHERSLFKRLSYRQQEAADRQLYDFDVLPFCWLEQ